MKVNSIMEQGEETGQHYGRERELFSPGGHSSRALWMQLNKRRHADEVAVKRKSVTGEK